jgi:hypothetical protein
MKSHQPRLDGSPPDGEISPEEAVPQLHVVLMTPEKDMTIDSPDEDLLGALKSAKGQDAVNVIQEQIIQYIVKYEE